MLRLKTPPAQFDFAPHFVLVLGRSGLRYLLNRKNCRVPEMGLVTKLFPLTTTGDGRFVVQPGETRFVVDCSVNPLKFVGQNKITAIPALVIPSSGGIKRLNTVPFAERPPFAVVP